MNRDKRVDEYIGNAKDFAKPILLHLRELIHKANPEIKETIKWAFPSFDYKGALCSMASFKEHAVFGFWKTELINDPNNYLEKRSNQGGDAMGNLGRITTLSDLPPDDILIDFISQACFLNEKGIKLPKKPKTPKAELVIPGYFQEALKLNDKAKITFENFSYSHKKEYIEWITEAKTEKTRFDRIKSSIEWLSEGKNRNWKYTRK